MQIFIASDHGGLALKEFLKKGLAKGNKITDLGCDNEKSCDYPDFAEKLAKEVAGSKGKATGILCCGTGIGMSMAANKVKGIRAAVVWNEVSAKMAKEHNNANVLCLGGRVLKNDEALKLVNVFLKSTFQGEKKDGERHKKRVDKIDALGENSGFPEPVVGALIFNEKNEVFLMKSPKWDGLYIIPGGHIELGENMRDALIREIKEETDLDIYDLKMFTLHDAIFPAGFHKKKHFLMVDFLAKTKSEKFKLDGKEGTKGVWMKPKLAAKELKLDQFTQKALEDYIKIMDLTKVV
jgi:ribose 5-phosphate isomerase B